MLIALWTDRIFCYAYAMQPNAPAPPPNQYDYILNQPAAPKRPSMLGGTNGSPIVKVVFVLIILTAAIAVFSVYTNLTKKDYSPVLNLAERQAEIVRVADLGLLSARDPNTLNYVASIRNITASENNDTVAFLKKHNLKVTPAKLALKKDTSIDKALATAKQDNTYDGVLIGKLNGLVYDYQKATKNVSGTNDTRSEKTLFATLYANSRIVDNVK